MIGRNFTLKFDARRLRSPWVLVSEEGRRLSSFPDMLAVLDHWRGIADAFDVLCNPAGVPIAIGRAVLPV